MRVRIALGVLLVAAASTWAEPPKASPLVAYVGKPDKSFAWKVKDRTEANGNTVYTLSLVSQTWQDIAWDHDLQVFVPKGAKPQATMVLWNQGGAAGSGDAMLGLMMAQKVGAPVAFLYGVPKQPLFGGKKEDALIAESFVRYLETKDDTWPLLFPMVKSVVRAMDALQAFAKEEWKFEVKSFVVTGASKRGWTTWLTAATGDPRVKAIAPLVIDTLNFDRQIENQTAAFGKPSDMIRDYTDRKLFPPPDTAEGRALWKLVDPYTYREAVKVPVQIINGTNDPYWPVDAVRSYWGELKNEKKYLCCVPNAGHDLRERDAKGSPQMLPVRAVSTLSTFARAQIFDHPMPRFDWTVEAGGFTVTTTDAPAAVRVWTATSNTRDFRQAHFTDAAEKSFDWKGGKSLGFAPPEKGFKAVFVEAEYKTDDGPLHLTTPVLVLAAKR